MMNHRTIISTLLAIASFSVSLSKQDDIESFVTAKMANYSNWLSNFDPSPKLREDNFRASKAGVNVDCTISYHGVRGHSAQISVNYVLSDLRKGWFRVGYTAIGWIYFYGQFTANGTILSQHPIHGDGLWYILVPRISTTNFDIYFHESPSGFLNICKYDMPRINLDQFDMIYFEGLLDSDAAAGYEEVIETSMYDGFQQYLIDDHKYSEHPIRSLYLKYWQEILAETTMADITDFKLEPSSVAQSIAVSGNYAKGDIDNDLG